MYKPKAKLSAVVFFSLLAICLALISVDAQRRRGRTDSPRTNNANTQGRHRSSPQCGVGVQKLSKAEVKRAKALKRNEIALANRERRLSKPENIQEIEVTVLVVYTPLVTKYLGSKQAVEQHIREAEKQANTSFHNSEIPLHIRVVRTDEVPFPESHDFDIDLGRVAFGNEGQQVRQIREDYHADQVALIVDDGNYGGLAFGLHPRWDVVGQPSPLDPDQFNYWAQRAFFEVRDDCIDESYKCFAHELAHNFGAGHDFEDWLRLYWDAHGYAFDPPDDNPDEGIVGTMMSYDGADKRKLYFSNPSVSYAGHSTGVTGRNNARAIMASMGMVARYK